MEGNPADFGPMALKSAKIMCPAPRMLEASGELKFVMLPILGDPPPVAQSFTQLLEIATIKLFTRAPCK